MITEREKKNRDELFRLMRENPDLPVVPMVDAEICGDDSGYAGCDNECEKCVAEWLKQPYTGKERYMQ